MIIIKRSHGYGVKRKYVHGKGFVDSLKSIGSYIFQNKDLIAKPVLGAVGNLAATGLTEGAKALINRLAANSPAANSQHASSTKGVSQLDPQSQAILQNIMRGEQAVGNIIGQGSRRTGQGIKRF